MTSAIKKSMTKIIILAMLCMTTGQCFGQGSFVNLDFELATVPNLPPGQSAAVSASDALPGWTAYWGSSLAPYINQNTLTAGSAGIDILGPGLTSANGIIQGNYTAVLQAGIAPPGATVAASISQSGTIPVGTDSLQVKVLSGYSPLSVSFAGNNIALTAVGSGVNYTLYSGNISQYAGQFGLLSFSRPGTAGSAIYFDNIQFVGAPEPSSVLMVAFGAGVIALKRRRHA